MLSADLKPFWAKLGMPALRAEAKAAIDQEMSIGILSTWKQVEGMILPFPRGDVSLQGEELESALAPADKAFDDETDEETDIEDAVDEDPLPISDAAAAMPAAHPLRPDPSPTSDAPSSAADQSLTANDGKRDQIESKRQRVAAYKAMLTRAQGFERKDIGLLNFLEGRIHDESKQLYVLSSSSTEAAAYQKGCAQHDAQLDELKTLQEEVRQADKRKLEERRAKRATKPQAKKPDKWQILAHMMPLADAVQLQIDTDSARRSSKMSSKVSDRTSRKEDKKARAKAKAKKKQEKKEAKAKKKQEKKQAKQEAKAKAKEKAKLKMGKLGVTLLTKGKGKDVMSKGKGTEPTKVSDLTPKTLVVQAKGRAENMKKIAEGLNPHALEAKDFGAGHQDGGSPEHKRNRLQFLCQLRFLSEKKGAELSAASSSIWDDYLAWQEQKWVQEFQSSPSQLGNIVYGRLCKWWSEIMNGKIRSFADHVDAMVQVMRGAKP